MLLNFLIAFQDFSTKINSQRFIQQTEASKLVLNKVIGLILILS